MRNRKIAAILLTMCIVISGCGNTVTEESVPVKLASTEESPLETEKPTTAQTEESASEGAAAQTEETAMSSAAESTEESSETEAETETETETETEPADGQYLEELMSFHLIIGKTEYTIPEEFQKFADKEWQYDGSKELTLKPNEYVADEAIYKDNSLIYVSLVNLSYDMTTIQDSRIGSVLFDPIALKDSQMNVSLPGDIVYGKSSYEEIIKAYGEPTTEEKEDTETILTYGEDAYSQIVFTVNKKKNVITRLELINYNLPEGELTIDEDTLEIVEEYSEPKELGKDTASPIVEIDSKLYQLPVPVKEFLDEGWTPEAEAYDAVAARSKCSIFLEKGDKRFKVDVRNYTDEVQYLKNCFVTKLEINKNKEETDVTSQLPGEIANGVKEEELVKLLGKTTYQIDKESDQDYIVYHVSYASGKLRLFISGSDKTLRKFIMENRPDEIKK